MASRVPMWALGALLLALVGGGAAAGAAGKCSFPAIFNFGDSNSDTGTTFVAFNDLSYPYGMSYKENAKRFSDGRVIIDYLAENLGLPYLESPLDTIGTSYKYGANFATGGSKISPILPAWAALPIPMYLDVQISEFLQFKSRTIDFYNQLKNDYNSSERNRSYMPQLPDPEVFAKALYTVDIGQNDDFYNTSIPVVIEQYYSGLQRLIQSGAKFLWLHNRGPTGCMPVTVGECRLNKTACLEKVKGYINSENELYDQHGCVRGQNKKTKMFNRLWKQSVDKLRAQYPDVVITTFDMYTAKSKIIANAQKFGFLDPFKQCCGNSTVFCGIRQPNMGPLLGTACQDPTKYISWDGIHYSQAANKLVANLIIEGSLTSPPSTPISRACHKP